jgi:hypothetical protein
MIGSMIGHRLGQVNNTGIIFFVKNTEDIYSGSCKKTFN